MHVIDADGMGPELRVAWRALDVGGVIIARPSGSVPFDVVINRIRANVSGTSGIKKFQTRAVLLDGAKCLEIRRVK